MFIKKKLFWLILKHTDKIFNDFSVKETKNICIIIFFIKIFDL